MYHFVADVSHEQYESNQRLNGDSNQTNMCHHLCKHPCAENDMMHPSSHYSDATNLIQEQESSVKSNVSTSITNVKTKCLDNFTFDDVIYSYSLLYRYT